MVSAHVKFSKILVNDMWLVIDQSRPELLKLGVATPHGVAKCNFGVSSLINQI